MRKILLSILVIGAMSALVAGGTISFFSDTEISTGNTFTAGTIHISIDGENPWSRNFVWDDIKPGKDFEIEFEITNEGLNPLKLWKIIKCVEYDDNGIIEPEQEWYDENNSGNPKNDIDSAIIYEMYVDGKLAISKEAGITMNHVKDNYMGLVKLDQPFEQNNGDGILQPDESVNVIQRYYMREDTENWAQSDKMTFVIEIEARQVSAPEPLQQISFMDNKYNNNTWTATADETMGILKYDYMAPTFNYDFLGVGLNPSTEYCLIYYADPWSSEGSGTTGQTGFLIDQGTPDSDGKLSLIDNKNINTDLPNIDDENYPNGAKIWLLPCIKYDILNHKLVSWSPDNSDWIFDNWPGLINYKQGDKPNEELNCDYEDENGSDNPNCTDNDGDGYYAEASGCEGEDGFLGHSDCNDINNPNSWRVGIYYYDGDDDGYYGDGANRRDDGMMAVCCGDEIPDGYTETTLGRDCNDNNPLVNPEAPEVCDNGLDDDCDGFVDCTDLDCAGVCTGFQTIQLNDLAESTQYGYYHDYYNASAAFTYVNPGPVSGKLTGSMVASGLKPYATYQVKLEGKPVCNGGTDDLANEYVGYKGRWTCVSGATCVGDANARNRTDAQYEANKLLSDIDPNKECIVGYLVFDYFTADASGNIYADDIILSSDSSYHVLYCGTLYEECSSSTSNDYLQNLDSFNPSVLFCPEYRSSGQPEPGRGGCNGLGLTAGTYDLEMVLTEESFHQGNWASVMSGDINFVIN
ncbi:SipW-dependent-type signal peptide-containing protein [Candidatus Parcubacteria bacterium]|nr:SipW-dependent-type signal peptide-containing protein [Candidatus Parcubacteria bacterium]